MALLVLLTLALVPAGHSQTTGGFSVGNHVTPRQPLPSQAPVISGPGVALSTTNWAFIGPGPQSITGGGGNVNFNVSGRIAGIAAHPSDPNTIYIAAAGGGVWKTTNASTAGPGLTWTPLTDAQATLSMGAVAVAPSNPLVIYAGTGEANNSGDSNYGRGILVSMDGGGTWTLNQGPANIFNRMAVSAISVDPTNANVAYASFSYGIENGLFGTPGIYKTTNGGGAWANTTALVTTTAPYSDVKIDPNTPSTVYAAVGSTGGGSANGVYKSTNNGGTWTKLTNGPNGATNANVGRISLAVSKSNSLVIYVTTENKSTGGVLSVLRSDDGGSTFSDVTPPINYMGGQGWYDQAVIADPGSSAIVYIAGAAGTGSMLRSADSGASWTDIHIGGAPNNTSPHVDHHALVFDANGRLLDGDDGGIYRLDNPTGPSWSDLNGNLGTIQFQGMGLHPTDPNQAIGGSQDNGTALYSGSVIWTETDGGDGGFAKFSQTNGSRVYHIAPVGSFGPNDFFRRSDDGGVTWASKVAGFVNTSTFLFYAPFVVDPNNGNRLLAGADRVYETTNGADLWSPISTPNAGGWTGSSSVTAIGLAPSDTNTIYAATCCFHIFATANHGASWTDHPLPVSGNVADIEVDPTTAATAYAVISNFTTGGNVFKTTNSGATWTNISGNLPSEPAWSLQIDVDGTLYAGTDDGVYTTANGGATWTRLGVALPNAQVLQLALNTNLKILAAATHGRGAWEIMTVLSTPNLTISKSHTGNFTQGQTGATYTLTVKNTGGTPTTGAVTVTDTLPAGLSASAMSGTGWGCTLSPLSCNRSDSLAAGGSYPAITLTVNVATNAPANVTNIANVSGGGEVYTGDDQASDPTTIRALIQDMIITKTHSGNFYPGQTGATYTITASNVGSLPTTGTVSVTDVVPAGLTATAISGVGWTCTQPSGPCTRSDALQAGGSYPPITLTVSVALNVAATLTNTATVAGGGETETSNDTANDLTTIVNNAKSLITYTFPDTALAGGSAFTMSVIGSGFVSGAVVHWNTIPLTTTFNYSSSLTASVPAALIASPGIASIVVANPGEGPSNPVPFTIATAPVVPTLTSGYITYSWYTATGIFASKLFYVSGSGFQQGMTLFWNGTNLGPVSSTLGVVVPLDLIQTPGPVSITARNPGGTPSASLNLTVPPLRTLTSISPAAVPAGNGSFTLTVNGAGFASGDVVSVWPGAFGLATQFISSTQLRATVPASIVASSATLQVWVNSYTSSGAFSSTNELPLTVGSGGPVLSITKTHFGSFVDGEQSATYTVTVSNASGAAPTMGAAGNGVIFVSPGPVLRSDLSSAPTSGAVTVTESVPSGLTLVSMAGTGWTCGGTSCARSDVLAGGASYPPITVTVNVSPTAPSVVNNTVTVFGGGSQSASATDPTVIGSGALRFVVVGPCRVADTRNLIGPFGGPAITGGTARDFVIPSGACGIPITAAAYSVNVTVVPHGLLGYLTVYPSGQPRPLASTLNSFDGRVKANAAVVPAGASGAISVFASDTTDVILDINGYFVPALLGPSTLAFFPLPPCRVADTRSNPGALGGPYLTGGQERSFPVRSSLCNVPATSLAYSLNFTAVPHGSLGYISTWPTGAARPQVSTLNAITGQVTANAAIVPVGTNGEIDVFASDDSDLVIDINGYFAPVGAGGLSLYNLTPCRVLDTRNPPGAPPFSGTQNVNVVGSLCAVPASAQAYVLSATVVPSGLLGYLTLWPEGQPQPPVSTLNALDGAVTSNMAIVPTTNGSISAYASNPTQLVLDISGYFAP